ncbi:MAG: arginine--tRNA ligase, partial [Desulfatiglandales bacterium]
MRERLRSFISEVLQELMAEGIIRHGGLNFGVEIPKIREHGHYSTNVAMLLAQSEKRNPKALAEELRSRLIKRGSFQRVEVAGPGFINIWLRERSFHEGLLEVLRSGPAYGSSSIGKGKRILLEFVSANPTGPLHLGHGRGAAFGDTLSRVLSLCGYEVEKEFYINDAGRQIRLLGLSIFSRYMQRKDPNYPFPEDGYHGTYVEDLLDEILKQVDLDRLEEEEAIRLCSQMGKELMMKEIRQDLEEFGVAFHRWISEKELYDSQKVDGTIGLLEEKGFIYQKDGATWLKSTAFGDDKDRV